MHVGKRSAVVLDSEQSRNERAVSSNDSALLLAIHRQEVTGIMSERFFTEEEVAERTRISLGTLRRWRLENRGPKFHKFGSLVRYAEDELLAWEEAQPIGGDGSRPRIPPQLDRETARLRRAG